MRKKYLSALLFGALVMASTATFTSCKDYDDDIDQVNTGINGVKSDLSSKMDAVNTSISGLTSAQSEIKSSLSAVNKQIETLTASGAKALTDLKAELLKADADQKAALEAKIAELSTKLEEQIDALNKQAALLSAQDKQITDILADLEATKAQITAASEALENKIAQNVTDIKALNEITATLAAAVDANMAEVVGKITALETAQANQADAISAISTEMEALYAIASDLADNDKVLAAGIEELAASIETLKQEMTEKVIASHDKIREELAAVDTKLGAEIEVVKNELAALKESLANQAAALELQQATLEAYKEAMEAADLDLDGKIGENAATIAANKEAADKAIADLNTLLETEVKGLNDKIDALDDRIKALEAGVSEADWQAIKKEIEDANKEVTTAYEKADKALEDKIDQLEKDLKKAFGDDLNTLKGNVNSLITNVSFVLQNTTAMPVIEFTNVIEKETKFGYDVNGNLLGSAITFQKNRQVPLEQKFNVRVSPASAVLDPSQISFVNSKGEVMPNVSVTKVARYEDTNNGYLKRAASAPTGIWEVTVQLNNYDPASFKQSALIDTSINTDNGYTTDNFKAYAMSVSNAIKTEENTPRNVTTSFDMTFQYKDYERQNILWFNVDGKPVSTLKNRADYTVPGTSVTVPEEYTWRTKDDNGNTLNLPAYVKEAIKKEGNSGVNTVEQGTSESQGPDARYGSNYSYFSASQGVPFTVSLTTGDANSGNDADKAAPKAVKAIYVTLDKQFAVESTPSEWEAWSTAYNYTGLNKVVEGTSTQITINSSTAINDIIGFRVYAVNQDGTLVDPDGKAFYVYVGNNTVAQADLTIGQPYSDFDWTKMISEKDPFSTANWDLAYEYEISIKDADGNTVRAYDDLGLTSANFQFFKENGTVATLLQSGSSGTTLSGLLGDDKTLVRKVQMVNVYPAKLKDGMTYTATITVQNTHGVVATGTITFKKALPAFPSEKVYPFTNVLQNNTLTVYPKASTTSPGTTGYAIYAMKNVWHGVTKGEWQTPVNPNDVTPKAEVKFKQVVTDAQKAQQDGNSGLTAATCTYPSITYPFNPMTVTNLKVESKFINPNTTENPLYGQGFPMKVTYDFGDLRYYHNGTTWTTGKWEPTGENFNIVLRNYADDCTFTWNGAAPVLVYNGVQGATDKIFIDKLIVKDGYNASVDLINHGDYIDNIEVHLLTGTNFDRVDEYYYPASIVAATSDSTDPNTGVVTPGVPAHIALTPRSSAAIPGNVPTKLQFVIKDSFGYTITKVINVPFTMTPRQ